MINKKLTREEKREERLAKLKHAATEIFSENGYHATKVSQIVGRVGVAQGTFYLYYEGKKPLFGELLSDFLQLLVSTINQWEPAQLDNLEVLEEELQILGLKFSEVLLEKKQLTRIFFREAFGVDEEFDSIVRGFYETLYEIVAGFCNTLWDQGLIEKTNFQLLAIETIGMVERVIEEYIVNESIKNTEPSEVVNHLVVKFISGTHQSIRTRD